MLFCDTQEAAAARRAADPARAAAKAAMDRQRAARREAQGPSVLDRIAEAAVVGPLAALGRAYEAGGRVRVVTRHARGVRGHATGAHATNLGSRVAKSWTSTVPALLPAQRIALLDGLIAIRGAASAVRQQTWISVHTVH